MLICIRIGFLYVKTVEYNIIPCDTSQTRTGVLDLSQQGEVVLSTSFLELGNFSKGNKATVVKCCTQIQR